MKLKEKFENVLHNWIDEDYNRQHVAEELETDAEEFAIGFAEWISYRYKYLDNKGWFATTYHLEMGIFKTSIELLEIYKKEKGL
jgi:hypothetical protein